MVELSKTQSSIYGTGLNAGRRSFRQEIRHELDRYELVNIGYALSETLYMKNKTTIQNIYKCTLTVYTLSNDILK